MAIQIGIAAYPTDTFEQQLGRIVIDVAVFGSQLSQGWLMHDNGGKSEWDARQHRCDEILFPIRIKFLEVTVKVIGLLAETFGGIKPNLGSKLEVCVPEYRSRQDYKFKTTNFVRVTF